MHTLFGYGDSCNLVFMTFAGRQVLVTGGAGFIGSNLVHRLLLERAQVTVVDSLDPLSGSNLYNLHTCLHHIDLKRMDLADIGQHPDLLREVEVIFNLSGSVSHRDSMTEPLRDLHMNTTAHLALLDVCARLPRPPIMVYASTRQVYGIPRQLPLEESHPIYPVDVNGINKHATEQFHRLYADVYGLPTVTLRLTNTYGPRQHITSSRQGVLGWFINRAMLGETIQLFGGGGQIRDFTFVDDATDALLKAAQHTSHRGQVYNVSGGRASLHEVAQLLVQIVGRGRIETVEFPPELKKIDVGNCYASGEAMRVDLGWSPTTHLAEGLRRTISFYRDHLAVYLGQADILGV